MPSALWLLRHHRAALRCSRELEKNASWTSGTIARSRDRRTGGAGVLAHFFLRLCPYADICCWDGCANRCLNFRPPENVFFRESVGVFVN